MEFLFVSLAIMKHINYGGKMPGWLIPIAKWLGHWLVYFILSALLIFACWATFIKPTFKPNPTSVQTGGIAYEIHVGFGGCARIPSPNELKGN